MAFIKRSTVKPVSAKVGKRVLRCSQCGKPFVQNAQCNICSNCRPEEAGDLEFDFIDELPKTEPDQE